MGVHGGEWRVHASAVDDIEVIVDALTWLGGDDSEVSTQKEKSTLGAPMNIIIAKMTAKQTIISLGKLRRRSIEEILDSGVDSLIDDDKNLHLRLSLEALSRGGAEMSRTKGEMVAKGKFKLEVYPGQSANQVAVGILEGLIGR
tara:strand:- start:826 stop:1257 length:432 start_codon:yes stop_codon:yes gene_type:complete